MGKRKRQNNDKMSLGSVISFLISAMIGSAIFSLSGTTIVASGSWSLLSWVISGLIMLFYGIIVAKLSVKYPKSGGIYFFPALVFAHKNRTLGRFLGFISAWGTLICNIIAIGFSSICISDFICVVFPRASSYSALIAGVAILVSFIINLLDTNDRSRFNFVMVLVLIILLCIYCAFGVNSSEFSLSRAFSSNDTGFLSLFSSIPTASVGYGSIVSIAFVVEEVKDRDRNVKRGMLWAMFFTIILYVLSVLTTLGLVTRDELVSNNAVFIPFYFAINKIGLPFLNMVVSICAVVALLTTIIVIMRITALTLNAVSEDGLLPRSFSYKLNNGTPNYAMMFMALVSVFVLLVPNAIRNAVNLGAVFSLLTIIVNIISYIASGSKLRNWGLKVFWAMLVLIVLIFSSLFGIVSAGINTIIFTLVFFVLGVVVFVLRK